MQKAILFDKLTKSRVKCTACAWKCIIEPDQVGVCATRLNRSGILYSLVYGRPTGLELDPVEKKPLHHFLPGSSILSFGTVGCNFGCEFCQNAWMSQTNKINNLQYTIYKQAEKVQKIIDQLSISITPEEIVEKAIEVGAKSIAYTYNEPAIFVEFAHDTAVLARKKGLKNVFVSNGYESAETYDYMSPYLDGINIDLKSFREDFYLKVCKAHIQPVKDNIKRFFDGGIETEVTTLIIPGQNDSTAELTEIALFLKSVSPEIPWHISAFHPDYKMTDLPVTPHETLIHAYEIGKNAGLHYIYVGNVDDTEHSSTYCPGCRALLVAHNGYNIRLRDIDNKKGRCKACGTKIYGIWN